MSSFKMFTAAVLLFSGIVLSALDGWLTNYDQAVKTAKKEKKVIFALFTGSDWCPYCMYLENDVLTKPEFKKIADKKYVLLYVDFPKARDKMTKEQRDANAVLSKKFGPVEGFPSVLLISPQGKVLKKAAGFRRGSTVEQYMAQFDNSGKSKK